MVLSARREIDARAVSGRVNVNELAESFPDRTYESIKGVRKRAAYKELLMTLETGVVEIAEGYSDPLLPCPGGGGRSGYTSPRAHCSTHES